MKVIYISSACCPKNQKDIDKTAKIKLENNIIKFHNSIIKGIAYQYNINVESIIGLPISIRTNKKIIWRQKIHNIGNIKYIQIEFMNVPILKQLTMAINMYRYIKNIIKINSQEETVIIYDASFVTVMPLINRLINKYNLKSIGVFADIYDYMEKVDRKSDNSQFVNKIFRQLMRKVYNDAFGYVFLTEQMNELININKKPYIVMEGIVDDTSKLLKNQLENKYKEKVCIYAGGLYESYGVKNLVEAFKLLEQENIRLHIYGKGELEEYLKNIQDTRIKYLGVVDNEYIMEEEIKATLLINPRFTNEEYTKYSFPSKNMEYMASGTPILTTKLPGMPEEYYDYIYCFEDESIKGMKEKLEIILSLDKIVLHEKGLEQKKFITTYKNNLEQTKRIMNLILTKEED